MQIRFISDAKITAKTLVVLADSTKKILSEGGLSKDQQKAVIKSLAINEFTGKKGHAEVFTAPRDVDVERLIVVGVGDAKKADALVAQDAGGGIYKLLSGLPATEAVVAVPAALGKLDPEEIAAQLAYGAVLRAYKFDKYLSKAAEKKAKLATLAIATREPKKAEKIFADLELLAKAVHAARDLQNEPANIIYPKTLAKAAVDLLTPHGVKVTVLGEAEMKKLGMGALLGVGQGSEQESQLVVMEYYGAKDKKAAPLGLVGKGVTFDTGGISIKPSGGMEDMKWDMGGAAVVIGSVLALASRKARTNVVGVVGLVENMPSGNAQRPGDIVKSMSGLTIEVLNTDAEGRLVLADALWYCQKKLKPATIIDFATLTGAVIVALGDSTAGLFANDEKLARHIENAAKTTGEPVWRLPMNETYDKMIDAEFADLKNIANTGKSGPGCIVAAQFLQRFIDNTPWAHVDIAGVTWTNKDLPTTPKGATAFGIRMVDQLVRDQFED